MIFLWARRICLAAGCLMITAGMGYGGLIGYLAWQESTSPSTSQVLVTRDGRHIPLIQPTRAATPVIQALPPGMPGEATPTPDLVPSQSARPSATKAVPQATSEVLPPLRVKIPEIAVDRPVVLADNNHMPRFKGVGWMMGTAYPGQPGNMVLFGHLDGTYSTFGRLSELRPGDKFSVTTEAGEFTYQVRDAFETTPDDVSVLAPTDGATATLITCSGRWDTLAQNYSNRLIVKADYIPR